MHRTATHFLQGLDSDWAKAIKTVGPCTHRPPAGREPHEALARAVAYQQLTPKAGDAILKRLVACAGGTFPTPAKLLTMPVESLRACGFSARKAATLQAIAQGALDGLVPSSAAARTMADEELVACLTTLKGIGRWSAEIVLIFGLGRMDILPVDDYGVREGYRLLKNLPQAPTPAALRAVGQNWAPHRTVASWYLWHLPRPAKKRA
ncbi:DNA-3-methyladenine glycosylase 2 family protein [Formicincola oecophyllae]|uniref:DNA-3-methyladenine glycosylase II n=1 Tax=Formicincola oecophyllae TaxID=2558361 RepID=A0A4Y6U7R5_9PROT|nr:DNA-3-methyladenine glycosylase [Formicincola oecophyllae]QDH13050.1 DNA-3-methyladenine glycosylase 2 family protein [Formicincola oecophyllae]